MPLNEKLYFSRPKPPGFHVPYEPRECPFLERCMFDEEPITQPLIHQYRSFLAQAAEYPVWMEANPAEVKLLAQCYRNGIRLSEEGLAREPNWRVLWLGVGRDFDALAAMSLRAASIPADGITDPRADAKRDLFLNLLYQHLKPLRLSIAVQLKRYGICRMPRDSIPEERRWRLNDQLAMVDVELMKLLFRYRATTEFPRSLLDYVKVYLEPSVFRVSKKEGPVGVPFYDKIHPACGGGMLAWADEDEDGGPPDASTIEWRGNVPFNLEEANIIESLEDREILQVVYDVATPAQHGLLDDLLRSGNMGAEGLGTAERMKLTRLRQTLREKYPKLSLGRVTKKRPGRNHTFGGARRIKGKCV